MLGLPHQHLMANAVRVDPAHLMSTMHDMMLKTSTMMPPRAAAAMGALQAFFSTELVMPSKLFSSSNCNQVVQWMPQLQHLQSSALTDTL